ncbi:lysophosphatidic acid receptor 6-like [Carettochelys insculpta]|uniref:lysophosphatidic acid receptor 6-like n=1 Tax=Carettochelys insculpta TaxID=44489 RepID=UPI003EB97830
MNCSGNSSTADVAFVGLYALIFTLGLALNLAALGVFCCCSSVHSVTTVYMQNLAVSDLLMVFSLPVRVYYYSWRPCLAPQFCELTGLLLLLNMYSSIFLLTCISGDRCLAVCFPLHARVQAVRKQARCVCLGVWLLSCAGTVPTYFTQTKKNLTNCFDAQPYYVTHPGVSSAMALGFGLPLLAMGLCSWALLRAVHRSAAAHMALVNSAKIRRMILANLAIFLGCFLPFHLVLLCYQVPALQGEALHLAYRCALLLASANAALDPLAYYFATETFQRVVLVDNLRRACGLHSASTEGHCRSLYLQEVTALPDRSPSRGSHG